MYLSYGVLLVVPPPPEERRRKKEKEKKRGIKSRKADTAGMTSWRRVSGND